MVAELDRMRDRIADRFTRSELRARVREYVSGLVRTRSAWGSDPAGSTVLDVLSRAL